MDPCQKTEAFRAKNLSFGQSSIFLITHARKAFIKLKQAFVEASILNHFDLEHYIQIEIDALSYVIGEIFSQLTSDDLGQW